MNLFPGQIVCVHKANRAHVEQLRAFGMQVLTVIRHTRKKLKGSRMNDCRHANTIRNNLIGEASRIEMVMRGWSAGVHKRHRTRLKAMGRFGNRYFEQHAGNGYSKTESISAKQLGQSEST